MKYFSLVIFALILNGPNAGAVNKTQMLADPAVTDVRDQKFDRALDCQSEDDPMFSKIKMISRYAEVHVQSIVLLFADTTTETVNYNHVVHRGRTTQWVRLKHQPACVIGVRVVGTSLDRDLDYPKIEVWGR